jgi:endonuclease/exonuclease/phosphatase family metal-dependent hydrolase
MPATLRITTFNVENLFNRYAFLDLPWDQRYYEQFVEATGVVSIASRQGDLVSYAIAEIQRNNTALAILDAQPDILAVQEIENIYTLRNFNDEYLDNYFDRALSIDGNDLRGIDVGLLIKKERKDIEILNIRTHVEDAEKGKSVVRHSLGGMGYLVSGAIFSRDCLEVDLRVGEKTLTLLINHFKSQDGKKASDTKRTEQAQRVAELVNVAAQNQKLPIVLGDLNASPENKTLEALVTHSLLQNPFLALPQTERWTHYYVPDKTVSQLDYILPHMDVKVVGPPETVRNGLTSKCKQYTGPRYPTIGPQHAEASDHCPTTVVVEI